MINLKTKEQIETLKVGGQKLAKVINETAKHIKPGVSTDELNKIADKLIKESGGKPSFLNYTPIGANRPYPASICISINEEIVHGIPNEDPKILKEGDVITLDAGMIYEDLYTDHAITYTVGEVSKEIRNLLSRTKEALDAGIKQCVVGNRIGDISAAIEKVAKSSKLNIVEGLTGHGVGFGVHEDPFVPNEGNSGEGEIIEPGLVIAIEPMFALGSPKIVAMKDGYTYKTQDDSISAQFEHTVAITESGPIVLTKI
jgi:methionyl aminopeptidase